MNTPLSIAERTLQRAYTLLIRNRVFSFAVPVILGVIATAIVGSLALSEVENLSNQVKASVATEMQVSSSRLTAYAEDQYDSLIKTSLTGQQETGGSDKDRFSNEIWTYDAKAGTLRSRINGKILNVSQSTANGAAVDPTISYENEVVNHFNALKISTEGASTPMSIRSLRNATVESTETGVVLSVPHLDSQSKLSGIVTCVVPSGRFMSVLSTEGLAVADTLSGRALVNTNGEMNASALPFIRKGEPLADEFFSTTANLELPGLNKNWQIWSVYYKDQFLVLPGMKRVTTVYSTAAIAVWVFVFFGISGLQRAKNRQRKLLDSLVRSNNELIFIVNYNFQVESVIGRMTSQLGWKPEEYGGVDFRLFIHEKDRGEFDRLGADDPSHDEADNTVEVRIEKRDGEYQWYQISKSDMTHVPEILGWVITATNIEQRKRATEHIIAAKRAAERANEAKSEFLSRMSHELRTPLNAILGFGQLLEMGDLEHRQKQNVDQILNAGRHLLNLVNDILDIARIETRKVNLSMEQVCLKEVVDECVALMSPVATQAGIVMDYHCDDVDDVKSDRQRLKQALLNLISNAIKYNKDNGTVKIDVKQSPNGVKISVTDTGVGIEAKYLDRIFTPFDRLGADQTGVEGTGLGLALSKTLIEAMDAELDIMSQYGVGSTFSIAFPASSVVIKTRKMTMDDVKESLTVHSNDAATFTVLLIEDNLVNHRLVAEIIDRLPGYRLQTAIEGGVGLEMVKTQKPDLILLDLDLPDLPGEKVLESLRNDPETADLKIIVMSAESNPAIVEKIIFAGADKFVSKPIDVHGVLDLLGQGEQAA